MMQQVNAWIRVLNPKRLIYAVSGYLVVVIFSAFLLLKPQSDRYRDAIDKQFDLDDTYVNLLTFDIEDAIDIIDGDLSDLKKIKSNFEDRVLKDKSPSSIVAIIKKYCSQTKLRINELQLVDESIVLQNGYEKQFIRLRVQGNYSDFLKFLKILDLNPEWILIENLVIRQRPGWRVNKFDLDLSLVAEEKEEEELEELEEIDQT